MPDILDLEPEWWTTATVWLSTFARDGHTYTVSTVDYLRHPLAAAIVAAQDEIDHEAGLPWDASWWHYETMLFIDGNAAPFPFGNLPGHPDIGVYERHTTEELAREGHLQFVLRAKRHLAAR